MQGDVVRGGLTVGEASPGGALPPGHPSAIAGSPVYPTPTLPAHAQPGEGASVPLTSVEAVSVRAGSGGGKDTLSSAAAAIGFLFLGSPSPHTGWGTPPVGERMTVYTLHRLFQLCGMKRQHCGWFVRALLAQLLAKCYPSLAGNPPARGLATAVELPPAPRVPPTTSSGRGGESSTPLQTGPRSSVLAGGDVRTSATKPAAESASDSVAVAEVRHLWVDEESWERVCRLGPVPLGELLLSQPTTGVAASGPLSAPPPHTRDAAYVLCVSREAAEKAISRLFVEELRGQMMTVNPIPRWRMACRLYNDGEAPLIIFCGGTSGSGKSTLASLLGSQLGIHHVLSTDTVRQLLRTSRSPESVPELFTSTYEAYKVSAPYQARVAASIAGGSVGRSGGDGSASARPRASASVPTAQEVVEAYRRQADEVLTALDATLDRLITRGQSVVVEGVHLLPAYMARKQGELLSRRVICLSVLVLIRKEARHMERFSVRAKSMSLDPGRNRYVANLAPIRMIQSHLSAQAEGLPVLSINNTNVDKSLMLVHHAVLQLMEHVSMEGWPSGKTSSVPVRAPVNVNAKKMLLYLREHRNDKNDNKPSPRRLGPPRLCCDRHAREDVGHGAVQVVCPHNPPGTSMCNYCAALHALTTAASPARTRSAELLTATQRDRFDRLMDAEAREGSRVEGSHGAQRPSPPTDTRRLVAPAPLPPARVGEAVDGDVRAGRMGRAPGAGEAHLWTARRGSEPGQQAGEARGVVTVPAEGPAPRSASHGILAAGRHHTSEAVSPESARRTPKHSGDDEDEVGSLLDPSERR